MKKMRDPRGVPTGIGILAVCLSAAVVISCRNKAAAGADPTVRLDDPRAKDRVILQVDGASYTNADFDRYVRTTIGESATSLSVPALSRLFDSFVDEKILLKRAQDRGTSLTDDEKRNYLERLRKAMAVGDEASAPGDSDPIVDERLVVEKYLSLLVKDLKLDDKEIAAYYTQHKSDYLQPDRVQVSQILLAAQGKASEVGDKLKDAKEKDFRDIARSESAGPEASKGGVMGIFSAGQLPPELEKFIFPMKEGEISPVVESAYGYHIFRLDKKFEARLISLADAAASIRTRLADEKGKAAVAEHLEMLKAAMDWKTSVENLPFPYQRIES
jgi:parvulin-like peptidyl-prolyl isomerase